MHTFGTVKDDGGDLLLTVDGKVMNDSSVHGTTKEGLALTIWPAAELNLGPLSLRELLKAFWYVSLHLRRPSETPARWSFATATALQTEATDAGFVLDISVEADLLNWDRPFSIVGLQAAVKKFVSEQDA